MTPTMQDPANRAEYLRLSNAAHAAAVRLNMARTNLDSLGTSRNAQAVYDRAYVAFRDAHAALADCARRYARV